MIYSREDCTRGIAMDESSTAVIVGDDVELWSMSRTKRGLSCLRTIYANAAAHAYTAIATVGLGAFPDGPAAIDALIETLPINQPTASIATSVPDAWAAVTFFLCGRDEDPWLYRRAQRLVTDVSPLLTVVT